MCKAKANVLMVIVGSIVLALAAAVPAGPINPPPGPVTSTHKTLTDVEPRIAVNAVNTPGDADTLFKITQPGSYYLTGNLTGVAGRHGIEIAADNVTLDLTGFTMSGGTGSLSGVSMQAVHMGVVIRNGHVTQWGQRGIAAAIDLGRIEHITATFNGTWGIRNTGTSTHIVSCAARSNGAGLNTGGISGSENSLITDCISHGNTGMGVDAGPSSIVMRCIARSNTSSGITIALGGRVQDCVTRSNSGGGIRCTTDAHILCNTCFSEGQAGVLALGGGNRIEGNTCIDGVRGIDVDAGGNLIIRNSASGNSGANFDIASGNITATIVTSEASLIGAQNANVNMSF